MEVIGIIQIGEMNSGLLSNLAHNLNRIQSHYEFMIIDKIIDPDTSFKLKNGSYEDEYFLDLIRESIKIIDIYTIGITNYELKEDWLYCLYEGVSLISIANWGQFSKQPVNTGLHYLVAVILMDIISDLSMHYESKGCPSDYCENKSDIDIGISKSEYCNSCKRSIVNELEKNNISIEQISSINRIYDFIAKRIIGFVILPFSEEFKSIYVTIKKVLVENGIECYKADEIFSSTTVVNVVNEMLLRSEIIIADLTDRNSNVFYELGFAHANNKNTILITRDLEDIPFNIRHRKYLIYKDTEDLALRLTEVIKTHI